ncbi:hypothetical protein [Mangrovihabitans endophyticus]|nr:hypothetical protein [Mangrovihabitans endophyticus]
MNHDPIEWGLAAVRHRTTVAHWVALVRVGARSERGKLVKRIERATA